MPNADFETGVSSSLLPTIAISDGLLPNGRTVDLIRDGSTGELKLLVFDGTSFESVSSIEVQDRTFVPLALDPGIQRVVTLSNHASDYDSTDVLFAAMRGVVTKQGISDEIAKAVCYFAFSTFFAERSLPAPCLVITGPAPEATILLQLLECFVRRGFRLVEIDGKVLQSIVNLRPTLLIDGRRLSSRNFRRLSFNGPRAFVPCNGSVVDFALAKAIYLGPQPVKDFSTDFAVHVHLVPSRESVTLINDKHRERIIAEFQPRLLDYRFRNLTAVRDSVFDPTDMDSESRVIAQMLGTCIIGSDKLQAGVRQLFEHRTDALREGRFTDLTCVVLEALLALCHRAWIRGDRLDGYSGNGMHVNDVAKEAEVILKGRGAPTALEPRAIGSVLDLLKLTRKRDSRGMRINLEPNIRCRIHELARNYQVESIREDMVTCDLCRKFF